MPGDAKPLRELSANLGGRRATTGSRRRSCSHPARRAVVTVDQIARIVLSHGNRELKLGRFKRVNAVQWLALIDAVADLLEQLDPRPFVQGCAGRTRHPVEAQAIDGGYNAIDPGANVSC
jgi:hypothetical protein